MRRFWLFIGWMSLVGSITDGLIALYALGLAMALEEVSVGISVDLLFRDYISWLYWIKALVAQIFDRAFVEWVFALPAIPFYLVRVVVSYYIGRWALRMAAQLKQDAATD